MQYLKFLSFFYTTELMFENVDIRSYTLFYCQLYQIKIFEATDL